MESDRRIDGFVKLGKRIGAFLSARKDAGFSNPSLPEFERLDTAILRASAENPWFTEENILHMLASLAEMLDRQTLTDWLAPYRERMPDTLSGRTVAVIMAGNIPMVGFHDFLCTLITGNTLLGRLSSEDSVLIPALAGILVEEEPLFGHQIRFTREKLDQFDAVIATGSDASARQFDYYFSKFPRLIRGNRNSAAILTGEETPEELNGLGEDLFRYFGRGCRSVSHLFLPRGYDPERLAHAFPAFSGLAHHHKFKNNYDYRKSLCLMNGSVFYDGSFFILCPEERVDSPVSVVHYSYYSDREILLSKIAAMQDRLQVVAACTVLPFRSCRFGQTQFPGLFDYADGVDYHGVSYPASLRSIIVR